MVVAVVGDVVGSRDVADQARLLSGVRHHVARLPGARSAAPTIGDEFQAVFDDLGSAIWAVARLRLALLDEPPAPDPVALRVGFGVGDIVISAGSDAGAPGQSGSAWWAAREALERVATPRRAWPTVRWWVAGDGDLGAAQAALIGLDTVAERFDAVDVSLARGLLEGETATALAGRIGITKQSVSQRLRDHGVYGWVRTLQTLTAEHT